MSQSVGIPLYNGVWGGGSLFRVIQQQAVTFISFHQTLFTTPTCAPHLRSSCHTKLLPAGSEGEDAWERWRMDKIKSGKRKKRKTEGETRRVGFREAVSRLLALILFARCSCLSWQRQRCMGREKKKKEGQWVLSAAVALTENRRFENGHGSSQKNSQWHGEVSQGSFFFVCFYERWVCPRFLAPVLLEERGQTIKIWFKPNALWKESSHYAVMLTCKNALWC